MWNKPITQRTKLSQLGQYEIDHLNSLVTIKEIKLINLKLWKKKSPGLYDFTGEFYQMFKEKAISILHHLL